MTGRAFFDAVIEHADLVWIGIREGSTPAEDEALVGHTPTGLKHAIAVAAIIEQPWEELEGVLTGKRDARLMTHLSRIVGYYSRVRNWNSSKIAELHDRQAGNYGIPLQVKLPPSRIPQPVVDSLVAGGAQMACKLETA